MSKFKNTGLSLITIIATAGGAVLGNYIVNEYFNESLDPNDKLLKIAEEANKVLPVTVDSETILNSTMGLNGEFTYNYTLTNYSYDELDIPILKENMGTKLRNNYCTTDAMKPFRDMSVNVNYIYFGNAGKQLLKLTYGLSDCEG